MAQTQEQYRARLGRRKIQEKLFRACGVGALALASMFLIYFFVTIIQRGYPAFTQAYVQAELTYNKKSSSKFGYRNAVDKELQKIVSRGVLRTIPLQMKHNPEMMDTSETKWVLATADVDQYLKGKHDQLTDAEKATVDRLVEEGLIERKFNVPFFTNADSKLPEMAGIRVAITGTVMVLLITMAVALPIGIMTSIYLEEFAPDNKLTQVIEVNINNLAAIPSIIFGLLGLSIVINFLGVPRSSALAAGLTLGLMMLPVIIIATRAALRSVPDSIREAAYGVGASPWQVVAHHVLPLSLPGIMTGTIISMARAMGETAPLLIVGLMAYVSQPPGSILEGTTVLPAQIYMWTTDSERAYIERTAAAILILLVILLILNAGAIWLRNRTERQW